MIRLFKKYFIPHEHNDHRPHLLRFEAALIILSAVLLVETYFLVQAFWIIPSTNFFATVMPDAIVGFTNQYRSESDLNSLKINTLLTEAAQLKAEDMAKNSYFNHTSPEGLTPWHWLEQVGYRYSLAGENLAINFIDSQDAIAAWMSSPDHRANILNNNFTEIGIGTAKGLYQGRETVFIVQFFGRTNQAAPEILIAQQSTEKTKPILSVTENSTESFVAVKGIAQQSIAPTPIADQPNNNSQTFWLKRWLTTPRATSNYFYFVMLTIISLALLLKIFVKIKIQHPALIVNGTVLLIIISLLIWTNQYIALIQARVI
ncbi:MAG: CAP domain-containing protein [Patescibacteria group bacterium]